MITGNIIKSAIATKLSETYPNEKKYTEIMAKPSYPNFFINQADVSVLPDLRDKSIINYFMIVQYRNTSDPSTDITVNSALDEVGINLVELLRKIQIEDKTIYGNDITFEKVDGILSFSVNYRIQVKYPLPEVEKMLNLENNTFEKEQSNGKPYMYG